MAEATDDSQDIVYLRPQTEEAIAILDIQSNEHFVKSRPPPPELCDTPLEGIPASHLSLHTTHGPNSNLSRESTPGPYSIHPRVLKLAFNTETIHTARGYYFGTLSDCQIEMPYRDNRLGQGCYFCIHYNFNSGALLIVAKSKIRVGSTNLYDGGSLLLMADTVIDCGGRAFQFMVEFPDLSQCAATHERNYEDYVAKFNLQNVLYMATSREQDPPIGYLHRSKAVLGHGTYGEVHKAVHIHTGKLCAIKIFPDKDEQDTLREVKVLSGLSHPNIIEYRDAFKFKSKVCIVMELAANDLYKHRDARKGSRKPYLSLQCIRHIMRQLLSGVEYIHGEGYTHRDLKPQNILVTYWDSKTDLPTVKLADFGLAGIKSDLSSLCGTPGYCAPEIEAEIARRKQVQKRAAAGFKTVHQPFHYNNSVDIWTLGRILKELLEDIPKETRLRGKMMVVNKQPAMQLAQRMMSPSPKDRPNASACLQHAWLIEDNPSVCKRGRSPTPGTAVVLPSKRVLRTSSSTASGQGSTQMLTEALFPENRNLEIEINNRTASGSIVIPGNNDAIPLSIDRDGTQVSTRRLVATIERQLAETRSLDHRIGLDVIYATDPDVRMDRAASMEPVQLDEEMQNVQWQLNRHIADTRYQGYEEFGEPGPSLPAICVEQTDIIMPNVLSQSMDAFNEGQPNDFSGASTNRGVTYPSEYDGSFTTGISHIVER